MSNTLRHTIDFQVHGRTIDEAERMIFETLTRFAGETVSWYIDVNTTVQAQTQTGEILIWKADVRATRKNDGYDYQS